MGTAQLNIHAEVGPVVVGTAVPDSLAVAIADSAGCHVEQLTMISAPSCFCSI